MNKEASAEVQGAIVSMIALLQGYESLRKVAISILESTEGEEFPDQKTVKDVLETLVAAPNPFDYDVLDPLMDMLDLRHNLELIQLMLKAIIGLSDSPED